MNKVHKNSKACIHKQNQTQYENLINSLRHAYDKISHLEFEHQEHTSRILDH